MRNIKQLAIAVALVAVATPAGRAFAGPIGDTGQFNQVQGPGVGANGYASGNGGEFRVSGYGTSLSNANYAASTRNIGNADPSFQTFCIEVDENTGSDPTYFIVGDQAVLGGNGGPSPDPLSKGTAWLYSQFAKGVLTNYVYTPGNTLGNNNDRHETAAALQKAIWFFEEESLGENNYFVTAAATQFGGLANASMQASSGYLGVYVLNTYSTKAANGTLSGHRQDFLYMVPDGGTTAMLLGGVLMGLGALRRKYGR
jgi:hypothetical protein